MHADVSQTVPRTQDSVVSAAVMPSNQNPIAFMTGLKMAETIQKV